uniref:Uncharacterized protein n=1 Tax=Hippocampus comes TaxID=109280 RepID=A0A3Q2X9S9_HIPCM
MLDQAPQWVLTQGERVSWIVVGDGSAALHCLFPIIGHGNHKEDSPFLNSPDEKNKNDFYDRNLALFEVF